MRSHLSLQFNHAFQTKCYHQFHATHIYFFMLYVNACINHVSSLRFPLLCLSEEELTPIEAEPIVELAEDWEDVGWYNVAGMALAGCPSAKDVARIATQKSIDKQDVRSTSEEEEESTEEEEEDEDPKAGAEKRAQREIKLLTSKIKNFK